MVKEMSPRNTFTSSSPRNYLPHLILSKQESMLLPCVEKKLSDICRPPLNNRNTIYNIFSSPSNSTFRYSQPYFDVMHSALGTSDAVRHHHELVMTYFSSLNTTCIFSLIIYFTFMMSRKVIFCTFRIQ